MEFEDYRTISILSQALWANRTKSVHATTETVSAVALLDLGREPAMTKTIRALLERTRREGQASNARFLDHPFYRLDPEERLILAALHQGNLGYRALGLVLDKTEKQIARLAWEARVRLGVGSWAGPGAAGPFCPDYDPASPWTQSFMDDQLPKQEALFLQNHLMACDSCRGALARCRDLYYAVESLIPGLRDEDTARKDAQGLEELSEKMQQRRHPERGAFLRSLRIFFLKKDVLAALALFALFIAMLT